ncbi:MAG: L-lactate permease [Anaerolineae bacterium]
MTALDWILAAAPLLAVLVLMVGFRWGAIKAGPVGWLVAILVAAMRFGAGGDVLLYAQGRALLLTLDVLYVVWGAMLFYQVTDQAGALRAIGRDLPRLTADPVMQALLLAWVFASFLQGVGGFGVPVAVAAPVLLSLGVPPLLAVVMPSLGHGWAVTFGSLGLSFQALTSATGLPAEALAPWSAFLLGVMCVFSGAAVAQARDGLRGLRQGLPAVLIVGAIMAVVLYIVGNSDFWSLGSTAAGIAGLAAAVALTRLPRYRAPANNAHGGNPGGMAIGWALACYAMLLVVTFAVKGVPAFKAALGGAVLSVSFPETQTALGWVTPAGPGREIAIFTHTGAVLLYASALTFILYHRKGFYGAGAARRVLAGTSRGALKASVGILALVGMAMVMETSGMTNILAQGLSQSVGPVVYPAVATAIGALGAFMTGSNTNSNVVFAGLQMQTAQLLGLSAALVLGVQTAAGAIGSVLAPTKLIVGASTGGMAGREGEVLRATLIGGVALLVILAVIAVAAVLLSGGAPV